MSLQPLVRGAVGLSIAAAAVLVGTTSSAEAATSSQSCGVISATGASQCFDTQAELTTWVESEMGTTSVSAVPTGTTTTAAATAGSSSFLLGAFYQNDQYGGTRWDIYGGGACSSPHGAPWEWESSFVGYAMDDQVTSFQGYSNCHIKLFENGNYTGSTYGWYAQSSNVGSAMNDNASAARFS